MPRTASSSSASQSRKQTSSSTKKSSTSQSPKPTSSSTKKSSTSQSGPQSSSSTRITSTTASSSSVSQSQNQTTSSSPGITSSTVSSSSSSVPTSRLPDFSGSNGPSESTAKVRGLAISIGVVSALLALLLIFLLWWFCIRRKDKNDGNINSITPHYHSIPTSGIGGDGQDSYPSSGVLSESIPLRESPIFTRVNNTNVLFEDNSALMRSGGATSQYGGIQKYG